VYAEDMVHIHWRAALPAVTCDRTKVPTAKKDAVTTLPDKEARKKANHEVRRLVFTPWKKAAREGSFRAIRTKQAAEEEAQEAQRAQEDGATAEAGAVGVRRKAVRFAKDAKVSTPLGTGVNAPLAVREKPTAPATSAGAPAAVMARGSNQPGKLPWGKRLRRRCNLVGSMESRQEKFPADLPNGSTSARPRLTVQKDDLLLYGRIPGRGIQCSEFQ
jgi:hypothetical protein